jgi:hypothetical protein
MPFTCRSPRGDIDEITAIAEGRCIDAVKYGSIN